MKDQSRPTFGNGKICYFQIPAKGIEESASFYKNVFGWNIRTRDDGSVAFDDGVGEVSGTFVTGKKPSTEAGVLVYIMVDDAGSTPKQITAHGGRIVKEIDAKARETTALFTDPGGNLFGIYQERRLRQA